MKPVLDATATDLERMRNACWKITLACVLSLLCYLYLLLTIPAEASYGFLFFVVCNVYIIFSAVRAWKEYFDVKSFVKPR